MTAPLHAAHNMVLTKIKGNSVWTPETWEKMQALFRDRQEIERIVDLLLMMSLRAEQAGQSRFRKSFVDAAAELALAHFETIQKEAGKN